MIKITVTQGEEIAATDAAHGYHPSDVRDLYALGKIRQKLSAGTWSFTDKEANVLMDALAESDSGDAESLFEKLTGRLS
jgi:hypothetical protein